jgi:ribosomal 50S subunit-recycling heat shock protein
VTDSAPARSGASRRIDKWLWCARRFKSRTLAAQFIAGAGVRVTRNGATERVDKPSFQLREGDEVSYMLGETLFICTVVGFAERRGPPAAARALCIDRGAAPSCMTKR